MLYLPARSDETWGQDRLEVSRRVRKARVARCRSVEQPILGLVGCGSVDGLAVLEKGDTLARIFVGNLPFKATDEDLKRFAEGPGFRVESAEVIGDKETGRSRGFGFIELHPEEDAGSVIRSLDGRTFMGRDLKVSVAIAREPRAARRS